MYWIDTHTHITMLPTTEEQDACMRRTLDAEVKKIVLASVDRESVSSIADFCSRHSSHAFPAMGLHPTDVKENFEEELEFMLSQLTTVNANTVSAGSMRYVAIGETGLDFYHDITFVEQQRTAFKTQLGWAKKFDLPLIFHVRNAAKHSTNDCHTPDATEEIISLLQQEQDGSLRGVFHCYSGTLSQAQRIIDLGFFLGIGGVITFKNAGDLTEVVRTTDIKHILLETDAPFLAPVPYRGQPNESSYIPIIGHKTAEVKGIPASEVAEITSRNAEMLFGI
jgi:TatD DNase family protein